VTSIFGIKILVQMQTILSLAISETVSKMNNKKLGGRARLTKGKEIFHPTGQ
jgi:hypothetical protein